MTDDERPKPRQLTAHLDREAASAHERWIESPAGSVVCRLQHQLLLRLLDPKWGETVLDVGCGTGETLHRLADAGLRVAGVDRSPAMVEVARRKLGHVPLLVGDATALPFADASFDVVILNTTLEYLGSPQVAVAELTRVARRRVYVGVLNRWSLLGLRRRLAAHWRPSVYDQARFYPFYEVFALLAAAGVARCRWGGVPHLGEIAARSAAVRGLAAGVAGWPNPFSAYLGFAAEVERLELVRHAAPSRIRVVPAPDAAIARVGIGRMVARSGEARAGAAGPAGGESWHPSRAAR